MKKNRLIVLFICILIIVENLIVMKNVETIRGFYYKNILFEETERDYIDADSINRNEVRIDTTSINSLTDEQNAWYTKYHIIAHAGGIIEGHSYTNSLEAWEESYKQGNRVFDVDLLFTSDSVLVARHSWSENLETNDIRINQAKGWVDLNGMPRTPMLDPEVLSLHEFRNRRIFGKYTPLDIYDIMEFMKNHADIYISTDMKDGDSYSEKEKQNIILQRCYQSLLNAMVETDNESLLDRVIVNIYKFQDYDCIKTVFPITNCVLRQHAVGGEKNYSEILNFCLSHNIHVVNVSSKYAEDPQLHLLNQYGIHTMVAIVDYMSDMNYYRDKGFSLAVSNFLYEKDFK